MGFNGIFEFSCNIFFNFAKVEVAGSNPVSRSKEFKGLAGWLNPFFLSKFSVHPFLHPFVIG